MTSPASSRTTVALSETRGSHLHADATDIRTRAPYRRAGISKLVFARGRGEVNRIRNVADAVDQIFGVSYPIIRASAGLALRARRPRRINPVDGGFEQLAITFLGKRCSARA